MKTPCLILALVASVATALAVDPPPGGAYPVENTALGQDSLFSLSDSSQGGNTSIGFDAMYFTTLGNQNAAVGDRALYSNVNGTENVAVGWHALYSNTSASGGVALGWQALSSNTTGLGNVAVGNDALLSNTTGECNIAIGENALVFNTTAEFNVALGAFALTYSTTGGDNTALGTKALAFTTVGHDNAAVGYGALNYITSGSTNVAVGSFCADQLTTGSNNIVLGYFAGTALTTGSNNIEVGSVGAKRDDSIIRLGTVGTQKQTFIAGISGVTVASGVAVMVNSKGQLGTVTSSARYKDNIQPMTKSSEAILSLKPVTFRYKKELDPDAIPQFGLVAEDVAKVDPDLVARDDQGKPYTVRYEAVNAMLLNEFLKAHKTIEEQTNKIQQLESALQQQESQTQAQLQQLTARLAAKGL